MKLKEICKIKHGFAFKGADIINDHVTKYILVTPGNFNIGGGFKSDKCKYYSENAEIPQDYILKENDLIITMTDLSINSDTLGYSALIPFDNNNIYLHNQRIGLVYDIDETRVIKEYLYWFMRTNEYQQKVVASQSGTAIHHTSPDRILEIDIQLPSILEQKKIVKILFDIENKIKINDEINDNLHEIIRCNYLYLISHNEFKEIELEEIADVTTGKRPINKLKLGEYPIIGANGIMAYTSDYNFDEDLIITGRVGTLGVVKRYYNKIWASDNALVIKTKYLNYIENYLNTIDYYSLNRGSTQPLLTQGDLKKQKVMFNEEMVSKFESENQIYVDKIRNNEEENIKLSQLRNTLLPKLMNGEIDLDNIEI